MGMVFRATTTLVKSGMHGTRNENRAFGQPGSLA
jgi:hypothetical protein